MPQQFDWRRFDRTAWVLMGCGVVAFIDTFIDWATANFGIFGTATADAWDVGFWAWFPMVLLIALGVAAFLPGLGFRTVPRLPVAAFAVSALVVLIVLIRWATYPSGISAGFGLVLGLILAVVAGVFTFLTDAVQEVVGQFRRHDDH